MKVIRFVSLTLVIAACGGGAAGTDAPPVASTTTTVTSTVESTTTTTEAVTTTTTADQSGTAGPLTAFRTAAARSAEESSGRYEGTLMLAASDQLPAPFTIYLNGAFNSERAEVQMDMSEAVKDVSAGDGAALGDFSDIRFVFDGERTFMKFPMFALMGVATDWVELPTSEALGAAGIAGVAIGSPAVALASYVDAGAEITVIGTETIRGKETTHYRMLFDVADLGSVSADVSVDELLAAGIDQMPMEVWIGPDDLIYRYAISFEGVADAQVLSMTYDFYDYGDTITIDLPNEDNVTPMDSLTP